jgi:hypothetical protein
VNNGASAVDAFGLAEGFENADASCVMPSPEHTSSVAIIPARMRVRSFREKWIRPMAADARDVVLPAAERARPELPATFSSRH